VPGGSASRSTASASTAAWLCAATVATVAMAHRRGRGCGGGHGR
jgi:hypothetical protein